MSRREEFGNGAFPEIRASDLSTTDARRSRAVSHEEFQEIAARGKQQYEGMKAASAEPKGLDKNWPAVVDNAYASSREPWGGVTVNSRTGRPLGTKGNKYALTAREPGQDAVTVDPQADREKFGKSMDIARQQFGDVLSRRNHHLGVFHDADKGTIDIDPVTVVNNRRQVEELGAYTRATGGAYHFKSGNGYWPPHVE